MFDGARRPSGRPTGPPMRSVPMTVLTPHPPVAAPSASVVWQEYRRTGDRRLRDRLVFTLAPLVRHAGAAEPDAAEAGLLALAGAVDAYAPERDGALEHFAWTRVRAALTGPAAAP